MKDLKAIKGTYYIHNLIAEGEHEQQDFKFAINDARKIARSLSAFANHRGGRLLVGVKDNGVIAGIRSEEDIYVMEQAAEMYCRPAQQLRFTTFLCENGLIVLRVEIDPSPVAPVYASEPDGRWRAYFRVADENIVASPLMVESWERRAAGVSASLNLGAAENRLLQLVRANPNGISIDEYVRLAHISRSTAEQTVVTLHSIGIIDFVYTNSSWLLKLNENSL